MNSQLDPTLRAAQKQASRDRDHADLASGRACAADVQRRNRFLNGFEVEGAILQDWKEFE